MDFKIKNLQDPKIISFFVDNFKEEPVYYEEFEGYKKTPKHYFNHTHCTVNILRAPRSGEAKNISRDGRIVNYKFGNAVLKFDQYNLLSSNNVKR